ncbi:MAG: type IX secretion system outer membrane channel protein PorV [Bacteroidetes bacterium]|nr:type IX secretion system outer membrane channel protein PorV [Bacteroidota bacterium]MCK4407926.1 type IX secretion system outer membrane channel protein PorV [Bacteroidales bacterium]
MKLRLVMIIILNVALLNCYAQNTGEWLGQDPINTITTAVPFLMIAPDARSSAMGDAGVSSTPDVNSMHWNPAKYAFIEKDMGFSVSYSPWLRKLVNDINLAYLGFYKRIDDRQTVAATLLYFSLGDITFTDEMGNSLGTYRPNEFSIDGTYSRKLSTNLSGAVAARFIYSNLTQGQFVQGHETHAGTSIAADVSVYWQKEITMAKLDGLFAWGINISNIGAKISYSDNIIKDFIPTNLRIGPSLTLDLDEYNTISFMVDVNKLLVPTPPVYKVNDSTGQQVVDPSTGKPIILKGKNPEVSVVTGMIQSFYDAPGGFSEEMREFSFAIGAEYWYDKQFALRAGFFYEDKTKGNRKFFTVGAGLRYNVFGLDFSYLIPLEQHNPLENTLRFSLLFNFDAFKGQNKE